MRAATVGLILWGASGPVALALAAALYVRDVRREQRREAALDALVSAEADELHEAVAEILADS